MGGHNSKSCANCGTTSTPVWRKDRTNNNAILCNACGKYKKKHGRERPISEAAKQEERERRKKHDGKCANCGTTSTPVWRKDPTNNDTLLCNACGIYKRKHGRERPMRPRGRIKKKRLGREKPMRPRGRPRQYTPEERKERNRAAAAARLKTPAGKASDRAATDKYQKTAKGMATRARAEAKRNEKLRAATQEKRKREMEARETQGKPRTQRTSPRKRSRPANFTQVEDEDEVPLEVPGLYTTAGRTPEVQRGTLYVPAPFPPLPELDWERVLSNPRRPSRFGHVEVELQLGGELPKVHAWLEDFLGESIGDLFEDGLLYSTKCLLYPPGKSCSPHR